MFFFCSIDLRLVAIWWNFGNHARHAGTRTHSPTKETGEGWGLEDRENGAKRLPFVAYTEFSARRRWTWRVDILEIDGNECRLLTAFEPSKNGFLAWLSLRRGDAYTMIARLEFHGHEPGLHCHASCDDLHNVQVGVVKPYPTVRLPNARAKHRRDQCPITEASALATSFGFFRVTMTPSDAMI